MKAVLVLALLALQTPLPLEPTDDRDGVRACSRALESDEVIAACTAVIQSGRWSETELSWAYGNRGDALADSGDMDRAMADYDRAIELDPQESSLYVSRCWARNMFDDFEGAIADCDAAIELGSTDV